MRHRVAGRKLSRETSHRRMLFRNQVTELLRYGKIVTTQAKAKEVRPLAEEMITLGKDGDLHSRRQASEFLTDRKVVKKLFDEIGPKYGNRNGGYTRIFKLGRRLGDGAPVARLELVEGE